MKLRRGIAYNWPTRYSFRTGNDNGQIFSPITQAHKIFFRN
jgi:hypothetical protein